MVMWSVCSYLVGLQQRREVANALTLVVPSRINSKVLSVINAIFTVTRSSWKLRGEVEHEEPTIQTASPMPRRRPLRTCFVSRSILPRR